MLNALVEAKILAALDQERIAFLVAPTDGEWQRGEEEEEEEVHRITIRLGRRIDESTRTRSSKFSIHTVECA